MATPVNDVMNVIASPDYGIKNIAGTNQEILAILQGTTKSQNSIHGIVDDIKNLIQKLVTETTEKKSIEIEGDSTKINRKHIQDILDETRGIRQTIDNLSKAILKQSLKGSTPAVAKLNDKASEKVAAAMIKNIDGQNKDGGLSVIVDAFNKLKNISLKDLLLGNLKLKQITKLFEKSKQNLNIEEKELNNIIKLINFTPKMIFSLLFVNRKIDKILENNIIEKLNKLLIGENSLLSLSKSLNENEKIFENANKASKSIKELITSLNNAMWKLVFASLLPKNAAEKGIEKFELITNKIFDISKKLAENKKIVKDGANAAKNITILIGNLLVTSVFLTAAVVTGVPAMAGALLLSGVVALTIPIIEYLSKNNSDIKQSIASALQITIFTGLMFVTTLLLKNIAKDAMDILIGSAVLAGVIVMNTFTFKILSKSSENIILGSISMLIMSTSLILFGIALGKITQATKDVTWKQFGIIAAITGLFGVTIAALGAPVISELVILGSLTMMVMGLSLIPFGTALGKITQATKDVTWEQLFITASSLTILGAGVASLGLMSLGIALGNIVLNSMTDVLYKYAKTLKIITNEIGSNPTKIVNQVLNSLKTVGDFFSNNHLKPKSILNANMYNYMMEPFGESTKYFSKLKELGSIPMKLVHQTLNAMSTIADFYKTNPITLINGEIWQARQYKRMLKPFGKTLQYFVKLKELGSIPMKLVHQTLNAMSTIANFYKNNELEIYTIWQARRYKRMLRPFGYTIEHLSKLKEMGNIPMKLVHQTLNAMSTIANYYKENSIEKEVIKQARRYKRMLRPFGKTLNYFGKLKEMGSIPMKLVHQTLDAISTIANFYLKQDVGIFESIDTTERAIMINNTIASFGKTLEYLKELKDANIPTKVIESAITSINNISKFYNDTNVISATKSIKQITNVLKWSTLNSRQQERAWGNINILNGLTSAMSNLSNINNSNFTAIEDSLSHTLNGVNTVDLGKVQAVTNMFNAFNGINKSESILNKFTESVKEFTETCQNLMDAMNYNTDAINNIDTSGMGGSYTNEIKSNNIIEIGSDSNTNKSNGVNIINVDEIARTIAEKINGTLSVDIPDTQVQLLINGTGGNEWTISRY